MGKLKDYHWLPYWLRLFSEFKQGQAFHPCLYYQRPDSSRIYLNIIKSNNKAKFITFSLVLSCPSYLFSRHPSLSFWLLAFLLNPSPHLKTSSIFHISLKIRKGYLKEGR